MILAKLSDTLDYEPVPPSSGGPSYEEFLGGFTKVLTSLKTVVQTFLELLPSHGNTTIVDGNWATREKDGEDDSSQDEDEPSWISLTLLVTPLLTALQKAVVEGSHLYKRKGDLNAEGGPDPLDAHYALVNVVKCSQSTTVTANMVASALVVLLEQEELKSTLQEHVNDLLQHH